MNPFLPSYHGAPRYNTAPQLEVIIFWAHLIVGDRVLKLKQPLGDAHTGRGLFSDLSFTISLRRNVKKGPRIYYGVTFHSPKLLSWPFRRTQQRERPGRCQSRPCTCLLPQSRSSGTWARGGRHERQAEGHNQDIRVKTVDCMIPQTHSITCQLSKWRILWSINALKRWKKLSDDTWGVGVKTHPPVVSHSLANEVGIVDDVVMRQGGALWSSSGALETDIRNKLLYLERKCFDTVCRGYSLSFIASRFCLCK